MTTVAPRKNPCYCINVRRMANTLTKFYDQAFEPIGLTTNQFSLLNDIHLLDTCNKSELAHYSRLDRTTVIRSLQILREKELIEEMAPQGCGVRLTETGRAAIAAGMSKWRETQKRIETMLGAEKLRILGQICADIETLDKR